jgi:hypothetical protein
MNDRYMTADQKARLWRFCIITGVIVTFLTIAIVMVGCPQYNKYRKDKAGEGALLEAESAKLVQLEEAKANLESEKLNALAEIERAKGAAEAIKIEDGQLTDKYIRYLFVRQTDLSNAQTIYIPTEGNIPILEAGKNR